MLYSKTELTNAIFVKLISTRRVEKLINLNDEMGTRWVYKFHPKYVNHTTTRNSSFDTYTDHADYVPEFSSITEIAVGVIENLSPDKKGPLTVSVVNMTGSNEKQLLESLSAFMDQGSITSMTIAGWNISNYQIPFLTKKMLINKVKLPFLLKLRGKKPWDISAIDVMRDYQGNMFGDIDLALVANQFSVKYDEKKLGTANEELRITMEIALAMSVS